ncbi:hypothetical protein [Pseudemcibacter aquimaris]|uniref:hypothetical protein n=1 Tax=Pseudemcibacter aquimaris TaxID=2857064 RepID=UPI0020126737|nr:hypothetical protein [Pseudemcibacter aquimaris]MCC3859868.1 hypothetical protein [Pseudemcibacter aquimaris]WDU57200.1 hypothetical protein KW060_08315 [Pseudemcibacter aquimaris]
MSEEMEMPANLTLEDVIPGIEKFVVEIEEEVKLHHTHPEWMDFDEQCNEEKNLIVRVELIMGMLNGVMSQFSLPAEHDLSKRISAAKNYFQKVNYI